MFYTGTLLPPFCFNLILFKHFSFLISSVTLVAIDFLFLLMSGRENTGILNSYCTLYTCITSNVDCTHIHITNAMFCYYIHVQ